MIHIIRAASTTGLLAVSLLPVAPRAHAQTGCEEVAKFELFGAGTQGAAGVPVITLEGSPTIGASFALRVVGAAPNATGRFVVGHAEQERELTAFGATLYPKAPLTIVPFTTDAAGDSAPLLVRPSVPANLCGVQLACQAVVNDAQAVGGFAFSQGVRVHFGEDAVGPYFPGQKYPAGTFPSSVIRGDWDQDGVSDLAVASYGAGSVVVYSGAGDGTFSAGRIFAAGNGPNSVTSGDWDQDGVPDLAVANGISDDVTVFLSGTGPLPRFSPTARATSPCRSPAGTGTKTGTPTSPSRTGAPAT